MNLQEIQCALRSDDEEIRRSALKSLKSFSLNDSLGIVITAMGDESWRVRKEAVEIFLCSVPDENSIEQLLELLRSEDNAGLRNSAAEAVIRLGSIAIKPLINRIADADADVRKFIIDVMGAIGDPIFVQPLLDSLDDPDANVASAAAEQLGSLGDQRVTPDLVRAIVAHESVLFRFSALEALGRLAPVASVPDEILKLAEQEILRKAVYDCLGNISDASSQALLLDGFSCQQKSARAAALKALFKVHVRADHSGRRNIAGKLRSLGGSDTIPGLLELFDTRDTVLTEALIWCSRVVGDIRFVPLLLESFVVDRYAEAALMSLKGFGQEGMAEVVARYSTADENARSALCVLIGECGYTDYSDLVRSSLRDNSASVRKAAAVSAGKLGLLSSLPDLVALIDDANSDVCLAAVTTLQQFALLDRAAVLNIARRLSDSELPHHRRYAALMLAALGESERLLLLVNDEEPQVRKAAVSSIGTLGTETACSILVMTLLDEDPDVRIAAADALGEMKAVPALAALDNALTDDDIWVQCAAMKAIGLIAPERILPIVNRIHTRAEGLLMITCLQLLECNPAPEARSIMQHALESMDRDIVLQARKSLERSLTNNI